MHEQNYLEWLITPEAGAHGTIFFPDADMNIALPSVITEASVHFMFLLLRSSYVDMRITSEQVKKEFVRLHVSAGTTLQRQISSAEIDRWRYLYYCLLESRGKDC